MDMTALALGEDVLGDPGEAKALHARLRTLLRDERAHGERDPFGNPILRIALELTRLVDRGEVSLAELDRLVRAMTATSFARRAERLGAYLGEIAPPENAARLKRLIAAVARPSADAAPIPFARFKSIVETFHYGVVFTAHPTFSMPHALARRMAELAAGPPSPEAREAVMAEALDASHRPPAVTLDDEFGSALEAIGHAQDALGRLHQAALEVAREIYPEDWTALRPRIVSLASWVGYDHDGRSDIGWADTLRMRLRSKLAQLQRQCLACAAALRRWPGSAAAPMLELAQSMLTLAAKQVEQQIEASEGADGKLTQRTLGFAHRLVEGREHAMTDLRRLGHVLTRALEAADEPELALAIAAMRSALEAHGLGLTHTHFRLNATQLHNAIRHEVGLETAPGDPSRKRSYLHRINDMLARVEPVTVNLGSLLAEKASAKRMFMIIAEIVKHIDSETPIRFLIAETENAFTLLVALYLARLFGVDHLVEISPLLETEEALHRGETVIGEALQSPHFRTYVEEMGRLSIQFGYSDSGRYIGQTAASFAIERLRLRIAELLARAGLAHVQVVLFNTHGESVGRGGHPSSLADRLDYLAPPASRLAFARHGIAVKEESSFQGGDGYLPFLAEHLAFATICRIAEASLGPSGEEAAGDPIYDDSDFASEFFAVVRQEFARLVDDPDYAVLLGAFGASLADRAGSRPAQRQHEYRASFNEFAHPSQIRAIVNNTILQQLGFLANTIDGVGRAAAANAERFRFMLRQSPRFRRAMAMVEAAMTVSDPDILTAYLATFAPGMWLNRSARTRNPARRGELRAIAAELERVPIHARLDNVFRRLQSDFLALRDTLTECGGPALAGAAAPQPEDRDELTLLHALRIAMIHRIYLLASHIPDFTPHQGLTRADLLERILHLDIDNAVALLAEIFPRGDAPDLPGPDFAEPATYARDAAQTYAQEHEAIFAPMAACFALARRIGAAITHRIGAIG